MTRKHFSPDVEPPPTVHALTCQQVSDNLMAYLKGGIDDPERQAIALHLTTCNACAQMLEETRLLETDLFNLGEQRRARTRLSPQASSRVQEQVYNRMSRSLFWNRARFGLQWAGAALAVVFIFFFGYQWLQNLMPLSDVALSDQLEPDMDSVAGQASTREANAGIRSSYGDVPGYMANLESNTPGRNPEQIAAIVVNSALEGDQARLEVLFAAMGVQRQATTRAWDHTLSECRETLTAADLSYQVYEAHNAPLVRVDILQDGRYAGELKMRQMNGEWFTVFTNPPLLRSCTP